MIDANENRSEGELNMKNLNDNSSAKRKRTFENFVHGIFLILGLVTVACVLLISIYLIVSGIPAIRQIGLVNFLFGKKWEPTAATPAFGILPFILTSIYGTAGAIILGVPIGEGTPLTIHRDEENGEETFSLPVDPDLRDILRDIMKK